MAFGSPVSDHAVCGEPCPQWLWLWTAQQRKGHHGDMDPRLKNLIGVLAVLALLPLAFGTLSGGVGWLAKRLEQLQEQQAAASHKRLVLRTKCTYADRRRRAEAELGPPTPEVPCPAGRLDGFHVCKIDQSQLREDILNGMLYLDYSEEECLKRAQKPSSSE